MADMTPSRRAGRPSQIRRLDIWCNGYLVGHWQQAPGRPHELHYSASWVHSEHGRPLSLSLPFTVGNQPLRGEAVLGYFDNLLPDGAELRKQLAERSRAGSSEVFALLQAIGRDCVGAVQLVPHGQQPNGLPGIAGEPLDEAGVAHHLRQARLSGTGVWQGSGDEFRISLAGAHEKTALLRHKGRWLRPAGSTPTTHIFKLPLGMMGRSGQLDMQQSVENEWLCSRILAAYGLPVASCEMAQFEDQRTLIVERFDRRLHSSGQFWLRLMQEDFCQVTSTSPERKYESDGGPGMVNICDILRHSEQSQQDLRTFMSAQIVFWMLAAIDGHAKNFSIQLLPGGRYQLTPLYDVLSAWPIVGKSGHQIALHKLRMAMAVEGNSRHYHWQEIARRHYNGMAGRCGLGADAEHLIEPLIAQTPQVIEQVQSQLPKGFPAWLADAVFKGLSSSAKQLTKMPPTLEDSRARSKTFT
jgi:serine/threonine-protein kinase HipA